MTCSAIVIQGDSCDHDLVKGTCKSPFAFKSSELLPMSAGSFMGMDSQWIQD